MYQYKMKSTKKKKKKKTKMHFTISPHKTNVPSNAFTLLTTKLQNSLLKP
jgi:hypothetical protein